MATRELTDIQERAAVSALWAYLFETESYLRSTPERDPGHDDCCPTATAQANFRQEGRAALLERKAVIETAIVALGGNLDER